MTGHAYGQAYQSGFDRTVRFLISRGALSDGAVEAAQAAWVRGWERLHQLRDESMVLTWVNTIALNAYRAGLRREKRAIPLSEGHCESEIDLAPIDLQTVLKACPQRERMLLESAIQGITTEELAGLRGVSKTAIRIRLMRARIAVRKGVETARIQRFKKACRSPHSRPPEAGLRVA
jgi:DNA-directed RNA polymerase specialized sigma24 family protein